MDAIFLSQQPAALVPGLPFGLVLTTLALVPAQFRVVNRLRGNRLFGIYVFLAVIGAYCDVAALLRDGQLPRLASFRLVSVPLRHFITGNPVASAAPNRAAFSKSSNPLGR